VNGSDGQKPGLSIRLFGPVEVRLNGAPLPCLRSRKGHWLLALLTLRHGQTVERSWLAGTLWPESTEAAGLHNLRNSLTALRRALGPEAARLQPPTPHTLCLDLAGAEVDVVAFDAAVRHGAQSSLESAVALYRGPLLEGGAEEWLFEERQTRQEAFLQALETLARHALAGGELRGAESYLRRAVAADPLRESAQRQLMQVLAASGNYAAVLQLYRELRLRLHHDLDTAPDPETTTLFQQLRTATREKAGVRGQGQARGQGSGVGGEERGAAGPTLTCLTPDPSPLTPGPCLAPDPWPLTPDLSLSLTHGRMVGRDAELAALKRQVDAARDSAGATLFLAGEPGIGKTRLATEVTAYARLRGFRVMAGRCDEQGAAPYQPLAEALREYLETAESGQVEQALPPPVACELVRLVPQVANKVKEIPQVPPLPPEPARQALTEAMRQFFAFVTTHDAPVLLFLDDLHWADEGSLALLHALARQARSMRLLILGTYRDVEVEAQHPLERTLAALNRERLSERISLRRLSKPAVAEMVAALLDEPLPTPFLTLLHRQTEGNPFFIEEMLKHLVEEGAIFREGGRWQVQLPEPIGIPHSIKITIERRLQRLSEESREALTLAAVIGQQFRFDLLLEASGLDEDRLLDMLDEWLGARLVVEERDRAATVRERYRFQHALIREVLHDELNLRRKARLHERVGLALEEVYAGALEEHLEELAHHFAPARSETAVEKGVDYCLRAGEKARTLYANEAAIRHLTAALELLDGLPADEPHLRKRWEVADSLRRVYKAYGALERVQEVLEGYLDLAQRAGYPWGMAAAHFEMAQPYRMHWPVFTPHGATGWERGVRLRIAEAEKSLQIAEQHGLIDWRARARWYLAHLHAAFEEDLPWAEALLRETLETPEALPGEEAQAAYGTLMRVCALQGKWDEVTAALRRSIPFGGPSPLYFCLAPIEEALNQAGKQAEFIAFCEEGKALYVQAGVLLKLNQWYLQPATPSEQFPHLLFRDEFDAPELRPEWQWHDPHPPPAGTRASSYSLSDRPGFVTLRAGHGVDLWPESNLNAPRLLLEVRGDFALETKMEGHWEERDDAGSSGLLVWKDVLNYLRFERFDLGRFHLGNVRLEARVAGAYEHFGRGRLRGDTYYLRLERTGDRFAALCSTDGVHWLTCGHVVLPVTDPLRVGVAALEGMVVHFDYVQVLGRGDFPPR
jgi:DNA-binding SARP family transcriptional activator/regulation of enolase protein 1 (concanavalin A-like superfamily)